MFDESEVHFRENRVENKAIFGTNYSCLDSCLENH